MAIRHLTVRLSIVKDRPLSSSPGPGIVPVILIVLCCYWVGFRRPGSLGVTG